jgi:hypothetical protein
MFVCLEGLKGNSFPQRKLRFGLLSNATGKTLGTFWQWTEGILSCEMGISLWVLGEKCYNLDLQCLPKAHRLKGWPGRSNVQKQGVCGVIR